ncbi:endonuclease/exonuclease/phosphatase family metal-dependent hydrolase [Dysgonomonas alginatilytica]|uniref:Endonuclease/exonuclease/phosphatase family metal-dependent hydrolase n=1 Tax=Dysgonomonas alginatilytica TaxID=1605892 RepID=A0A2V3PSW7_9BACT|nr:endonuclease/exonuclease/phosphatase family protein [Dysgonomonas alginatilytica]PXV68119.1 endonuclease/exonuclease/phosphatase family metal-dependent hydrolase [Dysgonomonas alginatilytica]
MKTKFLLLLCILNCSYIVNAQRITVATYNIRNENSDDIKNGNGWQQRLPEICNLIKYHNLDIIGTQEGLHNQLENIKEQLPELDYIGVGRDDGKKAGEYSAIFYKKNKYKLLNSGNFWLANNSSKPNLGWDAVCIRICTWGKFKEQASGKVFYLFNLHTDHVGIKARKEGTKLVLEKIKKIAGKKPAILTGDFNVDQNNESYVFLDTSGLLRDSYELSPVKYANNGTFNAFDLTRKTDERIDHIFLTKDFNVIRYAILNDNYWDTNSVPRLPSDHYPVVTQIEFTK